MPIEINSMAYSEEGLLIKEEFFGVSRAGTIEQYPFARITYAKFEYFVDEIILQISIAHEYTWDALNEEWWHIKITEMFYDEGPLIQSAITRSREYPNYPFFNLSQEFFTWTAEENLSVHLIQNWNHFNEEWVDHQLYSWDWNEAGQIPSELTEAFDPSEGEWVNVSRINRVFKERIMSKILVFAFNRTPLTD